MKKAIIILACLLVITVVALGVESHQRSIFQKESTLKFEGKVYDTLLYISTTEIDGKVTRSYATGIFLEDGTYFRVVGAQEINPGTRYSFTIEPDKYGPTWDELVKISEIK
jgi:hypothetical protein